MTLRPQKIRLSALPAAHRLAGLRACARIGLFLLMLASSSPGHGAGTPEQGGGTASGLPVPRFVSLKSDRVNVRGGPTREHDVTVMYTRAGLPVEITAEFDNWRRIRDWEGAEGWVYHSLLSGKRTAIVTADPAHKSALLALRDGASAQGSPVAQLQPGVLAAVKRCAGGWCRITGTGFDGWIEQIRLWGVYPDEKVE